MSIKKPGGGVEEYDLLNRLAADDPDTVAGTLAIAAVTTWGIGRCRMAAIIEATAKRHGWQRDHEQRALLVARTGWGI